jgi:hypothetical protein
VPLCLPSCIKDAALSDIIIGPYPSWFPDKILDELYGFPALQPPPSKYNSSSSNESYDIEFF